MRLRIPYTEQNSTNKNLALFLSRCTAPRFLGVLIAFAIVCSALAAHNQKSDEVKHDSGGSHLMAYHEAFQKQPAHIFDFRYFKNVPSVSARGSWKSVTGRDGDQLSYAQNSYLICTNENRTCVEATARAGEYPRADLQFYNVTRWDDRGLEAEDDSPVCVKDILTIEFDTARVVATIRKRLSRLAPTSAFAERQLINCGNSVTRNGAC
jgi:hypothetical protein